MIISTASNRRSKRWKSIDLSWSELRERLSKTVRTTETVSEYRKMSKTEQDSIKDVGGFVGGRLMDGRRRRSSVVGRSLITLDADYASTDLWEEVKLLCPYECCVYSTHKHSPQAPRLRFIFPLNREVTVEEYEPISRKVAEMIGIDYFDPTTHDPSRQMYWPSTSADGEFFYDHLKGDYIDADAVLSEYKDWRDHSEWAVGASEKKLRDREAKHQGDPLQKSGIVGLFCRTYDIHSAIERYLPEVYEACEGREGAPDRYTYVGGSTFGGAVVYNDGLFLYSHHATDPAGGQLLNAFDLVRVHLYGALDGDDPSKYEESPTKAPSYKAMGELINTDDECKVRKLAELQQSVAEDFGSVYGAEGDRLGEDEADDADEVDIDYLLDDEDVVADKGVAGIEAESDEDEESAADLEWARELEMDKRTGEILPSIHNIMLILENDPVLKGAIAYNELYGKKMLMKSLPFHKLTKAEEREGAMWRDSDDSYVRSRIEKVYHVVSRDKVRDAMNLVMMKNAYHPVREYLSGLVWDGVERAETLLIDYLNAEDTELNRCVTRTWLLGAVERVFRPGCKFDNVLMLIGPQGIGKSTLGRRLGGSWFSDSFYTVQGKEAYEQLRGVWIVEIGELAAMKRSEVEAVKNFISKSEDVYRAAFAENIQSYPRQCVFYGTTNEREILKDSTGGRRWWTVEVRGFEIEEGVLDQGERLTQGLTKAVVDQIWAEVMTWHNKGGYSLYLPSHLNEVLKEEQEEFEDLDDGDRLFIEEYINTPVPKDWYSWPIEKRRDYVQGNDFSTSAERYKAEDLIMRTEVCAIEYFYEKGLIKDGEKMDKYKARNFISAVEKMPGWKRLPKRKRLDDYGKQTVCVFKPNKKDLAEIKKSKEKAEKDRKRG